MIQRKLLQAAPTGYSWAVPLGPAGEPPFSVGSGTDLLHRGLPKNSDLTSKQHTKEKKRQRVFAYLPSEHRANGGM